MTSPDGAQATISLDPLSNPSPRIDVPALVDEAKARKIKNYPCHVNRASQIGHPCTRYLVFCRISWEDKRLHDVGLQRVFDLGNLYEQAVLNDFREAGLYIEEQQTSFADRRYQLTGHIDGKLPLNDRRYPVEIKSMNPFAWEKINTWKDLLHHRLHYIRGYVAQMQVYLFLNNEEMGLMFLVNKVSGQIKQMEIPLDYELCEAILQKCEAVNAHVQSETLPEPIEWEDAICGRCSFLHLCYPDRDFGEGYEILADDELEAMLDKRAELAPAYKEYGELDKAIKDAVKGKQLIVGHWEIAGKWVKRGGYTVPDSEYWLPKFRRIE